MMGHGRAADIEMLAEFTSRHFGLLEKFENLATGRIWLRELIANLLLLRYLENYLNI